MKKSYRLVVLSVFLVAIAAGAIQFRMEKFRQLEALHDRLAGLSVVLQDSIRGSIAAGDTLRLSKVLEQFSKHEKMSSAIVCSRGRAVAENSGTSVWGPLCAEPEVMRAESTRTVQNRRHRTGGQEFLVHARSIEADGQLKRPYSILFVHPLASVRAAAWEAFVAAAVTALVGALIALALFYLVARWLLVRSTRYLVRWVRNVFRGASGSEPAVLREPDPRLPDEFRELTKELSSLALKMRQERLKLVWNSSAASGLSVDPEAQAAEQGLIADPWAELRKRVSDVLHGRQLVIVANREPYSHVRSNDKVEVVRPASGVVTALEPIMRVCGGGIWVGHGSGNADREAVDANDEVRVPPEAPTYTLRRVWLSKEEEEGYYYGFANEGLWPLCHLAYTRPTFRLSDWAMYKQVNHKFADATLSGLQSSSSVILVQDYHYALLPRMLRERAPEASIELFWHIPWPNPEAFGICPQYKELLEGMLGADVIGFHTQYHCNNFLETCDRYLECRVDWERFSVTIGNRETLVRSYPISIATEPVQQLTPERRFELRARYGIAAPYVALGVDRLDYTKGLVERVNGVERFLEKYPQYLGKFTFVEMGTPSRTNIPSYRALIDEVEGAIERVNVRFGSESYQPIVLLKGHFDWKEVAEFYQLGQVCLVTSLHDGMNLVAKEYVWSQAAEAGALVLSRFTGAARELSDALIVNPYSSEEIADALFEALNFSPEERRARMLRMKQRVSSHNAFHWATDLLAGVSAKA